MALWVLLGFVALVIVLKIVAIPARPRMEAHTRPENRTLVVLVHGLLGRRGFEPVIDLARQVFPQADFLIPRFSAYPWSNSDPYRVANTIEEAVHETWQRKGGYQAIVLLGYSMGAMLLRKSLVWAYGLEEDRDRFGAHGRRAWVDGVERFVSLAGINRGWSIHPRPQHMSMPKYLFAWLAEKIAMLTRTHGLMLALRRGAPFIADLRVQWIRLARDPDIHRDKPLPLTIHLLGDVDDVVSREDSADLAAAKDTLFITLSNTGHGEIAMSLQNASRDDPDVQARIERIRQALTAKKEQLHADHIRAQKEDPTTRTIVYVMHGIRDFGKWGDDLKAAIEAVAPPASSGVRVFPAKYGFFPMGPFLLYWDRQKYVRLFMDEYTEHLAKYPRAVNFDYVGHSNGTYILASALERYRTIHVRRVFFAGSVVPQRYAWRRLVEAGRVQQVVNVAASKDWVVAIFPRFFEFLSEFLRIPATGVLDIGAAGFRGFHDGSDSHNRVSNLKFVPGTHGAAFAFDDEAAKRDAAFWVDLSSRLCWLVWLGLAAILFGGALLALQTPWDEAGLVVYLVVIVLILNSI